MTQSSAIGLIGLGVMGLPMARNIARAGLPLVVYNRSPGPSEMLRREGVASAASPGEIFDRCATVIIMLHDAAATDAVLGRDGNKVGVDVNSRTLINMATLSPFYSEGLAKTISANGGTYIEAPVPGSRVPAENGDLLIMAAGSKKAVEDASPIFGAVGKKTVYCGEPPNAMAMKSASNLMLIGVVSGIIEGVNFARAAGLDLDLLSDVILDGPMASDFTRMKLPRAIANDYTPQASIKNVSYSLDVALEATDRAGVAAPSAHAMRKVCREARAMKLDEEDVLALMKALVKRRAATSPENQLR